MKKYLFGLLAFLLVIPANAFTLPPEVEILTSPTQIREYKILGQVGKSGEPGSYLYGVKKEGLLGAYNPVTGYSSVTTQYVASTATTIPVASTRDRAGNQIVLSNISSSGTVKVYLSLGAGTAKEEPLVCTGLTATSWTNCTRGLSFQGSSETSSTTIAQNHNAGTKIIITNIGQFFNQYISVDGNQTVNDVKTFTSSTCFSNSNICLRGNGGQLQWTVDNFVNSYNFTSSSITQLTASTTLGIQVVSSQIGVNASTTQGMAFGADGKLYQKTSSTLGVYADSNGISINTSTLSALFTTLTGIATTTPTANKIPLANSTNTITSTWIATTTQPHKVLRNLAAGATWDTLKTYSSNFSFTASGALTSTIGFEPRTINFDCVGNGDSGDKSKTHGFWTASSSQHTIGIVVDSGGTADQIEDSDGIVGAARGSGGASYDQITVAVTATSTSGFTITAIETNNASIYCTYWATEF